MNLADNIEDWEIGLAIEEREHSCRTDNEGSGLCLSNVALGPLYINEKGRGVVD
jgi:hypothetical protein